MEKFYPYSISTLVLVLVFLFCLRAELEPESPKPLSVFMAIGDDSADTDGEEKRILVVGGATFSVSLSRSVLLTLMRSIDDDASLFIIF